MMGRYLKNLLVLIIVISVSGCGSGNKGQMDLDSGRYNSSVQTYKKHLAQNPGSAEDFTNYGIALLKTNQIDESIVQFQKALKISPREPAAIVNLGMAYLNKGLFQKAANTWRQYRNTDMPSVEEEITRLMTSLKLAQAQKEAELALATEHLLGQKPPKPNTMAVGYLKDTSPDGSLRPFQKGLTAMLITDMSKISPFRIVEREKLQALLEEMKLGQTGIVDKDTAPRVGKLLRVENIVTGSLARGSIEAFIGVASSSNAGGKKGSAMGRTEEKRFFKLPAILIQKIFKILEVKLTPEQLAAIGVPHTRSFQAFAYYSYCLDALDQGRWSTARNECSKAMREDPQFVLARDAYYSIPSDTAPTLRSLKEYDIPRIVAAAEKSIAKAVEKDAPKKPSVDAFDEGESGGGEGGGGH